MAVACIALMMILLPMRLGSQAGPGTPIPMTLLAADAASSATGEAADARSAATAAGPSAKFLGFRDREEFHRFAGWASGGLLFASGVVGAIHGLGMMEKAHKWRDDHDIDESDSEACGEEIKRVWNDPGQQALRWTHVGLLAAGETFYFADVFTGAGFWHELPPGWSKARIHRYAFFLHGGLMAAEGVLGFMLTDALKRGDHGEMTGLLAAHTAVGVAIPVVIVGAGVAMGG